MKTGRIGQLLFWFYKNNEEKYSLTKRTIGLSMLLSRLLNERYKSKPIDFLNLKFLDESSFVIDPKKTKDYHRIVGPAMVYFGVLDIEKYERMPEDEQRSLIWKMACDFIITAAESHNNQDLAEACRYAYEKGVALNYCTDSPGINSELILFEKPINAEVVFKFKAEDVVANLVLTREGRIVYEKQLHKTEADVGAFFYVFKKIVSVGNIIVVKGPKSEGIFPMTITLSPEDLQN